MDLSQFKTTKATTGALLHLESPIDGRKLYYGGNPVEVITDSVLDCKPDATGYKPVTISLLGEDSKEYQEAKRRMGDKRLNDAIEALKRRNRKLSSEEIEKDTLDLLVECTVGWDGLYFNSSQTEFSKEAAKLLYTDNSWIRDQAEAFIGDRANFMGN